METLIQIYEELAERIGTSRITDKNYWLHPFLPYYDKIFLPYRNTATNILEIGVGRRAGSLQIWQQYFSTADIYAWDIYGNK